jgi:hypothetical protein
MSFVDHYLPYFRQRPAVSLSAFPAFVYWKFPQRSAPCFSPLLPCTYSTPSPLLHVPFQFLVYYSVLFCFVGQGSVCPGGYVGLSQGWLWEYYLMLICSPVGLHFPSRFGVSIWQCRSPPVFSV